jgi:hypothetical protein
MATFANSPIGFNPLFPSPITHTIEYEPTIDLAEAQLILHAKSLASSLPPAKEISGMMDSMKINCLRKGKIQTAGNGMRYLVAVDGTRPAHNAFLRVLEMAKPGDHVFVVTAWRDRLPSQFRDPKAQILLQYQLWKAARNISNGYLKFLKDKLISPGEEENEDLEREIEKVEYTVLFPRCTDISFLLLSLVKQYNINLLAMGRSTNSSNIGAHTKYCQFNGTCSILMTR